MARSKSTAMKDGGNVTEVMKKANSIFERMNSLEAERKQCNDGLGEARSELEALGFNKHAVKAVRALKKLDIDLREGYDQSYGILRRAMALPVQSDLFEAESPVVESAEEPDEE